MEIYKKFHNELDPKKNKILDELTNYAINYFIDEVEPKKKYKNPNSKEKDALKNLITVLKQISQNTPAEEIQTRIYTVGKENGYEKNLRDWFKLIYEVCFGEENGPRMGFLSAFLASKRQLI